MPIIDLTDVVGIHGEGNSVYCLECLEEGWERKTDPDNFIMQSEIEDPEKLYVCDTCGEDI